MIEPVRTTSLLKIPQNLASDICAHYDQSDETKALLTPDLTPVKLINALIDDEQWQELVLFIAHSLPVREAVWWACCCLSLRDDWSPAEVDAIQAAKAWVNLPDETSRRYCETVAEIADLQTAPGWAAQAAFWSGGSMIAADQPSVAPPAFLYAHAVAGAVNLCAVLPDGLEAAKRYPSYIRIGLDIAAGGAGRETDDDNFG
ncbi:Uncharacterised protein [BD1-7 clade bacterium]|uniref:Twin-arginine translocation pathway signal n=1 Tax=BD1-7 clade bacterium TaxID=2029982 RepID=A0A5S9Q953_9GAMM|nr:Uncharacterised protein [BD1-7 clade bacterium]CAA0114981.1 Uncharacterised protein [BD1-7 clade bacterium]